jgi:hypothetical protein
MTDEIRASGTRQGTKYGWASIALAVVFALLYAYVLWNAIGNLIQLPKALGSASPWLLLILDVVLPVVVYVLAFLLGIRRRIVQRGLLFLIGFFLLAGVTVSSIVYVQTH